MAGGLSVEARDRHQSSSALGYKATGCEEGGRGRCQRRAYADRARIELSPRPSFFSEGVATRRPESRRGDQTGRGQRCDRIHDQTGRRPARGYKGFLVVLSAMGVLIVHIAIATYPPRRDPTISSAATLILRYPNCKRYRDTPRSTRIHLPRGVRAKRPRITGASRFDRRQRIRRPDAPAVVYRVESVRRVRREQLGPDERTPVAQATARSRSGKSDAEASMEPPAGIHRENPGDPSGRVWKPAPLRPENWGARKRPSLK